MNTKVLIQLGKGLGIATLASMITFQVCKEEQDSLDAIKAKKIGKFIKDRSITGLLADIEDYDSRQLMIQDTMRLIGFAYEAKSEDAIDEALRDVDDFICYNVLPKTKQEEPEEMVVPVVTKQTETPPVEEKPEASTDEPDYEQVDENLSDGDFDPEDKTFIAETIDDKIEVAVNAIANAIGDSLSNDKEEENNGTFLSKENSKNMDEGSAPVQHKVNQTKLESTKKSHKNVHVDHYMWQKYHPIVKYLDSEENVNDFKIFLNKVAKLMTTDVDAFDEYIGYLDVIDRCRYKDDYDVTAAVEQVIKEFSREN